MLNAIREKAQGWIAWFIVILISIPFALFGIQEYLGGGGETVVATVDGTEITERTLDNRVQMFRMNIREQLGDAYQAGMIDDEKIKEQILESLIRSELVVTASENLGVRASDAEVVQFIRNFPAFQVGGQFNSQAYEQGVRMQGLSQQGFEEKVRQSMVSSQLSQGISSSEFVTPKELSEFSRLSNQSRDISYITIKADDFVDAASVSNDAIQKYYDENNAKFEIPERVKLEYVVLDKTAIADSIEVTDDILEEYLQNHIDKYRRPEERTIRHILISKKEGNESALETIRAVKKQILEGASFSELAKQYSADTGSADNGGNLGVLEPGTLDDAFDKAAFSLSKNEISDPIETEFGYHLIEVTDIQQGGSASLAEVKDKVAADYRETEAERQYYDVAERFSDLAYSQSDSLVPVSESLGLKINESDWLDSNGGVGDLASPKVIGAAFSEDVLELGNNSETIELGEQKVIVLRVVEHEQVSLKPVENVAEEVRAIIANNNATQAALAKANVLIEKLQSSKPLSDIAQENDFTYSSPGAIKRSNAILDSSLVEQVFQLDKDQKDISVAVELENGDAAVVQLHSVVEGDLVSKDSPTAQSAFDTISAQSGRAVYTDYIDWLASKAEIVLK